MAPEGGEQPLITFSRHKQNINLWLNSLSHYNLTQEEISLLKSYLLKSYGLCIDQETIMRMSMDKRISNFTVKDANGLRKAIA
jgi:DNA polymerase-3 subunit alpha